MCCVGNWLAKSFARKACDEMKSQVLPSPTSQKSDLGQNFGFDMYADLIPTHITPQAQLIRIVSLLIVQRGSIYQFASPL